MRRVVVLAAGVAVGLAVAAAHCDSLGYVNGDTVHGTLKDVTFRAGDSLGVYSRAVLQSLNLSATGVDTLVLVNGGPREGEVVSVRFASDRGVLTVLRKSLSVIGLTPSETPAEPKAKEAKPPTAAPKEPPAPEPMMQAVR